MKKADLLFEMIERPEQYSEAQWQEILADDECRELYAMMAKTKGAFVAENADAQVTDELIESEWHRLASTRSHRATIVPLWRKIAAAAAIVIVFFGITVAAVHTNFFGLTQSGDKAESNANNIVQDEGTEVTSDEITVEQTTDTIALAQPQLYDNVPLEQILTELAAFYHVDVEYHSDDVSTLRLYYEWQPDYTLDKVLDMLNNFESFTIRQEGNKLIVESSSAQEGKQ